MTEDPRPTVRVIAQEDPRRAEHPPRRTRAPSAAMSRSWARERSLWLWIALGVAGFFVLPWYAIEEGFFSADWIAYYPGDPDLAPAALQAFTFDRPWLLPIGFFVLLPIVIQHRPRTDPLAAAILMVAGAGGLAYGLAQGFAIGAVGFTFPPFERLYPAFGGRQLGMGYGALLAHLAFLLFLTEGLARRGVFRGDAFVTGAFGLVSSTLFAFVLFPLSLVLLKALESESGALSLSPFIDNLFSGSVWRVGVGGGGWGVAWCSLALALLASMGSTLIGLAFALVATRARFPGKRLLGFLTVLPIITPPFVLGLALILIFGRAGAVTMFLAEHLGLAPTRYIFGLPGVLIAQWLSFSPIAFLVLIGVVEGISPSLEEAAQTLGASPWRTFSTVSLPLVSPGIANAFLLCFIESLADFGNPLVLGGSFDVLSTEIYYRVAGAKNDVPGASALALILLAFTAGVFLLQRRLVGRRVFTTVTGKADSGVPAPLPRAVEWGALTIAVPWAAFTSIVYLIVLFGGFVEVWGHDHRLTLAHYGEMFSVSADLRWTGGAWSSLFTTIEVALASAPLTAVFGFLTAYLLARQRFRGHALFELLTMASFAIPGTVVGMSYVLAFNAPPLELTGTGALLVLCFAFRNMPVGVRSGLAAFSQIDRSLDEASLMLGAGGFTTFRRVLWPLLKPAITAGLIYGFVRAMTAVSAVIFLVSADYDLATTYILGRVENGGYGPAIAYSSVLIVLMMIAIACVQIVVGKRDLGRREVL